ncbi:MAG TPA: MarR family transcriptional regulator [Pseudonocardiaceae bacterium]
MLIVSDADDQHRGYSGEVSSDVQDDQQAESGTNPELVKRLGYLLKHAQLRLFELTTAALEPFGLDGRQLAVLVVLGSGEPASQQEAARRLGIDRTTMVAFVDTLERKGFVQRRPHAQDRRKNVVELTKTGRDTLRRASKASDAAEQQFLAPLSAPLARQLREALTTLVAAR